MADEDERVAVKTYVPRSQKEAWVNHAESLGMSQSEFLRTMVQAGRRGFDPGPMETDAPDATPGGGGLEDRVLSVVAEGGVVGWDELVAHLAGDVEREVDEALGTLQDRQQVRYSGRHGGYVVAGDSPRGDPPDGPDQSDHPRETSRPDDGRRTEGRRAEGRRSETRRDDPSRERRDRAPPGRNREQRSRRGAGRRLDDARDDRRTADEVRSSSDRYRERGEGPRRHDGRRPPDRRPRESDERPRIDALREARESLDADRQWDERERPPQNGRRDSVRGEDERYDEY